MKKLHAILYLLQNNEADKLKHGLCENHEKLKVGRSKQILLDKYQIFTVAINHENVVGCRISPNVYTNEEDLEHFISSIKELAV